MKILHTSDWHLGISLGQVSLAEQQREMIRKTADLCVAERVDLVIIAGDVFDQSVPAQEAVELYTAAMEGLCLELGLTVLVIAGNHDSPSRLAQCSNLLARSGLHISGRIAEQKILETDDSVFHFFPYHNVAEVRRLFPEVALPTTERAMEVLVQASLADSPAPLKRQIALAHCFVSEALPSGSDRMATAAVGGSTLIRPAVFEGYDYVALGHLHGLQHPTACCHYSGSPLKYSFAEVRQKKGVLIYDTESGAVTEHELAVRGDLLEFTGTYEELQQIAAELPDTGALVRMVMTDLPQTVGRLDRLRTLFPGVISLSGVRLQPDQEAGHLSAEDLKRLQPIDILRSFCLDEAGEELSAEGAEWFSEAWAQTEGRER